MTPQVEAQLSSIPIPAITINFVILSLSEIMDNIYPDAGDASSNHSSHHGHLQTPPVSKATSKPSTVLCSECKKSCKRQQELQRHMLSAHFPRWLHCPHSPCPWRGHRKEDFKTHLELHPGTDPKVEPCLVYETRIVLDWIKNGTSVETAARYALDFVSERAQELGFEEEWKDLWG